MTRPFRRTSAGITARLPKEAKQLLHLLPELLGGVGEGGGADPAANRLRPAAHLDDDAANAEYHEMIAAQLDTDRHDDRATFVRSLGRQPVELTEAEAEAWLRVIGDARLVLATRMGIVDDYDWNDRSLAARPDGAMLQYLSYLQDGLVGALSAGLPSG